MPELMYSQQEIDRIKDERDCLRDIVKQLAAGVKWNTINRFTEFIKQKQNGNTQNIVVIGPNHGIECKLIHSKGFKLYAITNHAVPFENLTRFGFTISQSPKDFENIRDCFPEQFKRYRYMDGVWINSLPYTNSEPFSKFINKIDKFCKKGCIVFTNDFNILSALPDTRWKVIHCDSYDNIILEKIQNGR